MRDNTPMRVGRGHGKFVKRTASQTMKSLMKFTRSVAVIVMLKYIHVEKVILFLAKTLIYLNRIQHVSHHSIVNARAILPRSSK